MNGYYKQFREDLENPLFDSGVYDNFHAYSYLQANAQYHQSNFTLNPKIKIELQEHELFTSKGKLAKVFKWDICKVKRFLKQLQENGFIECVQIGKVGTKIKILKNECDQGSDQAELSIYKGLQGISDQGSDQGVTKEVTKQATKQNLVFTRDCENQATKEVTKQATNNIQEVLKNNSVCVYRAPQYSHLVLTDEQYNTGVQLKGKEKANTIFQQMNDYAARTNQAIANPIELFKRWNMKTVKEPLEPKQSHKAKKTNNSFNNFDQRNYDMNELERKLLAH